MDNSTSHDMLNENKTEPSLVTSKIPILLLGITSLVLALLIGLIAYHSTFNVIDKTFQQTQLNKAKQLAVFAEKFNKEKSDNIKLKGIEMFWKASTAKPDDEYICIVDANSDLILHSKAPQTVGKNAGKNQLTHGNLSEQKCLAYLTKGSLKNKLV